MKRKLEKEKENNRIDIMKRTRNTLFLLSSIDGKISLSNLDSLDYDKDLPKIPGINEGLQQYYDLEQETDLYSLNSGRVLAKIGVNDEKQNIEKLPVSFIIVDSKPHLTIRGVENLVKKSDKLFIVTTNDKHPAFGLKEDNLYILLYQGEIDFVHLFERLYSEFGIKNITLQSGGEMNSIFLKKGLIDRVSLVVAPMLIGGKETPSIIGGKSIQNLREIGDIGVLQLESVDILKHSYIHVQYSMIHKKRILKKGKKTIEFTHVMTKSKYTLPNEWISPDWVS